MKHLIGWAFLIVVIVLVLIGVMAEEQGFRRLSRDRLDVLTKQYQ